MTKNKSNTDESPEMIKIQLDQSMLLNLYNAIGEKRGYRYIIEVAKSSENKLSQNKIDCKSDEQLIEMLVNLQKEFLTEKFNSRKTEPTFS